MVLSMKRGISPPHQLIGGISVPGQGPHCQSMVAITNLLKAPSAQLEKLLLPADPFQHALHTDRAFTPPVTPLGDRHLRARAPHDIQETSGNPEWDSHVCLRCQMPCSARSVSLRRAVPTVGTDVVRGDGSVNVIFRVKAASFGPFLTDPNGLFQVHGHPHLTNLILQPRRLSSLAPTPQRPIFLTL